MSIVSIRARQYAQLNFDIALCLGRVTCVSRFWVWNWISRQVCPRECPIESPSSQLPAPVAQGIEQRFPKPCAAGSNPAGSTTFAGCGLKLFGGNANKCLQRSNRRATLMFVVEAVGNPVVEVADGSVVAELVDVAVRVGNVDFDVMDGGQAMTWVRELSRAVAQLQAALGRAQLRVDQSGAYQVEGWRDSSAFASSVGGLTRGESRRQLEVAQRASELPSLDAALRNGEVSQAEARHIVSGAVNDAKAKELIEFARTQPLTDLARQAARARASTLELESRADESRRKFRMCRIWTDGSGMVNLFAKVTPSDGAGLVARLKRKQDSIFRAKRSSGIYDTREQNLADALVDLASASDAEVNSKRQVDAKVIVDVRALKRGWKEADEVCEIEGCGEVSVQTARELMTDSLFKILVTDGRDVKTVTSKSRYWKSVTREAIEFRDTRCQFPGCGAQSYLEKDHIKRFSKKGETSYENARQLCSFHHRLITNKGYALAGSWQAPEVVAPTQLRLAEDLRAPPADTG